MAAPSRLLTKNFLSLSFVQAINSMLQLLVIPFVIGIVGADGFGVIAVAQVVMFYLSTLTDYGFNQTATRSIATSKEDHPQVSLIFFTVFFTRLMLCLFAFLILIVLVNTVTIFKENSFLYLTGFSFVIGQTLLLNWFFQGMEKMWYIAMFTLLGRVLFVLAVFLFIKEKSDAYLYLIFLGAGSIVAGIAGFLFVYKKWRLRFIMPSRPEIIQEIKEGWPFTLTNLSMNTCQYINIFILRIFTNDLVVGYFAIAERIYFVAKQVLGIFSQSAYPAVCTLVLKGKESVTGFFRANYLPFLAVIVIGSAITYVFALQVLAIFLGEEAYNAVFYLRMFCIATVIICVNIPGTLLLLARNQKRRYFYIYMTAGLINVVANGIGAYYFQSTGTVAAILLTEGFITVCLFAELKRVLNTGPQRATEEAQRAAETRS
jgi:PST family polysaccharide transporter